MIYLTEEGKKLFNDESITKHTDIICKSILYVFFSAIFKDFYIDNDFEDYKEIEYLELSNSIKKLNDLTEKHQKYITDMLKYDTKRLAIAIEICNQRYFNTYTMSIEYTNKDEAGIVVNLRK